VQPHGNSTSPAPDRARWAPLWTNPTARLCLLLALLAPLIGLTVLKITGSSSSATGHADECPPQHLPEVAKVDAIHLLALRTSLLGAMAQAGGRAYARGTVEPLAAWSDAPPQSIAASRGSGGIWPAAYEMRQWSRAGDDVAVDGFQFVDAAHAGLFLAQASARRCHHLGASAATDLPPQARSLTWVNPDNAIEADILLQRGARVYRVVDVRGSGRPLIATKASLEQSLATASRLACALPRAGCVAPTA
jgi:hypothetical protein